MCKQIKFNSWPTFLGVLFLRGFLFTEAISLRLSGRGAKRLKDVAPSVNDVHVRVSSYPSHPSSPSCEDRDQGGRKAASGKTYITGTQNTVCGTLRGLELGT
ncbi:hypothetical protein J6590_014091 [Homalodisca vitripennis]|nr:hypothetical protein J6590_014091 [Homalodisca vitripennis]